MTISKDTITHVAHLARIGLQSSELEKLSGQLTDILNFIDKLNKADIRNIKPTSHILPISNVLREDTLGQSLPREKILENAPQRQGNFFGVPKVIE